MISIAPLPMPKQARHTDDDVMRLLEGPVIGLREQAKWLAKCIERNPYIDRDLKLSLVDLAATVEEMTRLLLCSRCLASQHQVVKLGRGMGFDPVLCDECASEVMS